MKHEEYTNQEGRRIFRTTFEDKAVKSSLSGSPCTQYSLKELVIYMFNAGYLRGHHETVESRYTDIHAVDMETYHAEDVEERLKELEEIGFPTVS